MDASIIDAPSSTKNRRGERDQTKKGNVWYFGMKAHIGVDAESGLRTAWHDFAADVTQACVLLQRGGIYQGVDKRPENRGCVA